MSEHTPATHPHNAATSMAGMHANASLENIPASPFILKPNKFFFKKTRDKELGTLSEEKRATVTLELPVPTIQSLAVALHDEKVQVFVLGLIEEAINAAARQQVNDESRPVNKQDELDLSKLTLEYLSNEPKTERTGRGIPKETWEAFAEDYVDIMPNLTSKPKDKVETAAGLFVKRLTSVRTNKPVLKALGNYLNLYFSNTSNAEEFAGIYEYLNGKVETYLNTTDEELLANL